MLAVNLFCSETELEHLRINQGLEDVFEDVTAFGRVPQYPVVQAIVGIVSRPSRDV